MQQPFDLNESDLFWPEEAIWPTFAEPDIESVSFSDDWAGDNSVSFSDDWADDNSVSFLNIAALDDDASHLDMFTTAVHAESELVGNFTDLLPNTDNFTGAISMNANLDESTNILIESIGNSVDTVPQPPLANYSRDDTTRSNHFSGNNPVEIIIDSPTPSKLRTNRCMWCAYHKRKVFGFDPMSSSILV